MAKIPSSNLLTIFSLLLLISTIPQSSAFLTQFLSDLFGGFTNEFGPGFSRGPGGIGGRFGPHRPGGGLFSQGSGSVGGHSGYSPDYRGGGWSGPNGNPNGGLGGGLFNGGYGRGNEGFLGLGSLFGGGRNNYGQYGHQYGGFGG